MVLTTAGTLGDLYPVLSVATSLRDMGVEVRLLLAPDDCEIARDWGLSPTAVGPTRAALCAQLGLTEDALAEAFFRNPLPFLRNTVVPMTGALMPVLQQACIGAGCVSSTMLTFGASLAAEQADLPYVPLLLQPMLSWSALDPARGPGFDAMLPSPKAPLARAWNRGVRAAMLAVLRMGLSGPLGRVRRDMGLPPDRGTPTVDAGKAYVPLRLGLWSPHFAPVPADAPSGLRAVGFPRAPMGQLPALVQGWLDAGPPPLVVSLGSIAQNLGGDTFYDEALALARALGLRTVLLHGKAPVPAENSPDVLCLTAAAHAPLFPQAALVLHHGGMGTTTEALRSGRPQLIMPIGGDQPDNAARVARMGLSVTLRRRGFTAKRVVRDVRGLLDRFDANEAQTIARAIRSEDGAAAAARVLANVAAERT